MAFLGIGSKKQKKRAEAAQATAKQIIESGQELNQAQMQSLVFASDGKISRKEKKLIKQATRQESKTERTEVRQESKTARVIERQSGRSQRSLNRIAGRMANVRERASARKVAYENGMDPHAWTKDAADAVGKLAQGVVGVASANAFGGAGSVDYPRNTGGSVIGDILDNIDLSGVGAPRNPEAPDTQDNSTIMLVVAAVLAFFFLFKKRR